MGRKLEKLQKKREQIDNETRKLNVLHETVEHDRRVVEETIRKQTDIDDEVVDALQRVNEASLAEKLHVSTREVSNAVSEKALQQELSHEINEANHELNTLKRAHRTRFGDAAKHPEQVLNERLNSLERLGKRQVAPHDTNMSGIQKFGNALGWTLSGLAIAARSGNAIYDSTADNVVTTSETVQEYVDSQYRKDFLVDEQGREVFRTDISPNARLELIDNGEHFTGNLTVRRTFDEHMSQAVTDTRDFSKADAGDIMNGVSEMIDTIDSHMSDGIEYIKCQKDAEETCRLLNQPSRRKYHEKGEQ